MDPSVGDQSLDRLLGDLAPVRIEARQDDCPGGVVDDELDTGGEFEGPNIATFAADDPPLQVIARQVDDRHRRLDRVLRRAPLDRLRDDLLRLGVRALARLRLEPLHEVGGIPSGVGFDLSKQDILGLFCRQAGDPLKLALVLRDELLVPRDGSRCRLLPLGHGSLTGSQGRVRLLHGALAFGDGLGGLGQLPLEPRDLLAPLAQLVLRPQQEIMSLLFGGQRRLFLLGVGLALGIEQEPLRLLLGPTDRVGRDSRAGGTPHQKRDDGGHHGDQEGRDVDERITHTPPLSAPAAGISRARRGVANGPPPSGSPRLWDAEHRAGSGPTRAGGGEDERPRVAVWGGRMNLLKAGGTACPASL